MKPFCATAPAQPLFPGIRHVGIAKIEPTRSICPQYPPNLPEDLDHLFDKLLRRRLKADLPVDAVIP